MSIKWMRAVVAGIAGTAVTTFVGVRMAPLMGIPRMNPAEMLAGPMGGSLALGWGRAFHDRNDPGLGLRTGGAAAFDPPWVRGAVSLAFHLTNL